MPNRNGPVHVATTSRRYNGKVYQTHLLRRTFRDGGKVKHQTLGNLSHLPPDLIDTIRRRLNGEPAPEDGLWQIIRSLPHGHVIAVLATLRRIGLDQVLASRPSRQRALVMAMIVARVLHPASKLATLRALRQETATTSLSLELGLQDASEKELYAALDWLQQRQRRIETKLSHKHLQDGTLLLYDVSSSYYTGRQAGLVQFGYSRDGKRGFPQIIYGLLCNAEGCPVSIEVFQGNTADPNTLGPQIEKVRKRFGIARIVLVGDRGMITSKRIDEELRGTDGLDWITALRTESIAKLASEKIIQPSLFDERDLAEVASPDFPGERLIVCHNPLLADRRSKKRNELLQATAEKLAQVVAATGRKNRPLRGQAKIGLRVGKLLNQYKMAKHFVLKISDESFSYEREGGYANLGNYPPVLKNSRLYFSQGIVWDKQHPVLTRKDFMGCFEIAFYGWKEGAAHHFFGPNNALDLWHVKKVNPQSMIHLTEKPVELAVRAMQYSSRSGENVLDLFGGSGSTMIAAEQTGRRAFLMELDCLYADVIVQRYEKFTGHKAERVASTEPT